MRVVLQASGQSCPIAPGADLTVAISLLQMSVLGLPLLLALFQFVNDHEYPEPEETVSKRTVIYGLIMMTSAFLLWGFYYVAFCMIQSQLDAAQLIALLLAFMVVMLAVIFVILYIQVQQMVGEGARYSFVTYLFGCISIGAFAGAESWVVRVVIVSLAVIVVWMGWVEQTIGLEQKGEQFRAAWADQNAGREDAEETEPMEGMDSVYK